MTTVHRPTGRASRSVLVTDVRRSPAQEYALRRRRYATLMLGRVGCVIGAFVAGTVLSNVWFAGGFIAAAAFLPWAAVLIANDRLPIADGRRRPAVAPTAGARREVTSADPDRRTRSELED